MALGFCSLVCSCAPLPLCHMPGSGGQFSRAGLLLLALTAVEGERQGEIRTAGGMLLSVAQKSCRSSLLDFNLGPVQTSQQPPTCSCLLVLPLRTSFPGGTWGKPSPLKR